MTDDAALTCPGFDVLAGAPVGVVWLDVDGHILLMNPMAERMLSDVVTLGDPLMPESDWAEFQNALRTEKPFVYPLSGEPFVFSGHVLYQTKAMTMAWVLPSASSEVDWVTAQHDLIQQRKLANLGKLIVEITHELNNPLAGISMACQLIDLLLKKLKSVARSTTFTPGDFLVVVGQVDKELQKIQEATARASALRQEVLTYSKPNPLNLKPYVAQKLFQALIDSVHKQPLFQKMAVYYQWSSKSPMILADPIKMEQIVYNLFKNALDATGGNGSLWVQESIGEDTVTIDISDNGPGIPEALLDKIFSPFLTTKPRTGTGLGLSISLEIIEKHGGTLTAQNRTNGGASFSIVLPIQKMGFNPTEGTAR